MPSFTVGLGSICSASSADKEVAHWGQWLLSRIRRPFNPFAHADPTLLFGALTNAANYLLSDRLEEGIGKGGWGRSDRKYMQDLYGEEAIQDFHDSVMTTTVVVEALYKYLTCLAQREEERSACRLKELRDAITHQLDQYLEPRWDKDKGHGGVLHPGRENDVTLVPRYRHTAWLMRLWVLLPGYRKNCLRTAQNLVEEFDRTDWSREKVATDMAAHSAFSAALDTKGVCGDVGDEKISYYVDCLEDQVLKKFEDDLPGWTSGRDRLIGRQPYTLFVLTEMAAVWSQPSSRLAVKMETALRATMREPWSKDNEDGVAMVPNGPPEIGATSLFVSALLRKPQLSAEEQAVLRSGIDFLLRALNAPSADALDGTYSWALSYFLKDACRLTTPAS